MNVSTAELAAILRSISHPTRIKLCTVGAAKIGKSILDCKNWNKVEKLTIGEYLINFDQDKETIKNKPPEINLNSTGKGGWQVIINGTPLVEHKDTHEQYIRVMPKKINKVSYLVNGRFGPAELKKFLPPSKGKFDFMFFPFKLSSIRWIEINNVRYTVK